ncbi:endolytic transglycosylase MltG [Pediococcus parvulus]|uniref:endolytic transglycosylase MltG n=1 Tax=Pediococcus parvulus TaxID=54062 RepID=UPI0021A2F883|nr:endolytic transglycosylase MltG [Pediococcus parvulus]MCT3031538.1 endolytic transglycosylase MltG [Pediococcus parvulus]
MNNQDQNGQDKTTRQRKQTQGHSIIRWVTIVLAVVIVATGFIVYHYFSGALEPLNPDSKQQIQINVPEGSSTRQIGSILQEKKVVKSGAMFSYYVKSHNITNFKAGYYVLKPSMTLNKIAKKLQKGGSATPVLLGKYVLIKEGETIDEVGSTIEKSSNFTQKQFIALMNDKDFINSLYKKYPDLLGSAMKASNVRYRLEGYLYPATYSLGKKTTLKSVVTQMVAKENDVLKPYYAKIKKQKMTVQEVLSLAALVEREGNTTSDRQKIAGVFLNRLAIKMPLQSDVSVYYAVKKSFGSDLTTTDLKDKSLYNLRLHKGYGPGPVNNPSEKSVLAVLHPKDRSKDYLYFVANLKTGKIYFSKTYDEHLANAASQDPSNK